MDSLFKTAYLYWLVPIVFLLAVLYALTVYAPACLVSLLAQILQFPITSCLGPSMMHNARIQLYSTRAEALCHEDAAGLRVLYAGSAVTAKSWEQVYSHRNWITVHFKYGTVMRMGILVNDSALIVSWQTASQSHKWTTGNLPAVVFRNVWPGNLQWTANFICYTCIYLLVLIHTGKLSTSYTSYSRLLAHTVSCSVRGHPSEGFMLFSWSIHACARRAPKHAPGNCVDARIIQCNTSPLSLTVSNARFSMKKRLGVEAQRPERM